MKRISHCLSIIIIALAFFVFSEVEVSASQDEIFNITYGDYQDETVHYVLDYIDPSELEEEGFFDRFNIFSNLADGTLAVLYNFIHEIVIQFPFYTQKLATTFLIWLYNMVYEVNFIDGVINTVASSIQSVAGISGNNFRSTGLFGGFLGIISIVIALYTLFQFIIKKASISAFSGLLKSLMALVMALVFFSNYTTIVTGLNSLSVEVSSLIVSGNMSVNDQGNVTNSTAQDGLSTTIWNTFIHKPYLMLQYGTMDESSIGNDRIVNLLSAQPDSDTRYNLVKEEVLDHNNEMMSRSKFVQRIAVLYLIAFTNAINSIPILILTFALLFFQFWFVIMAMIAPFVFVWGALPNQFNVIFRYLLELITPLVLKIAVSVFALIIFTITNVVNSVAISTINEEGLLSYGFLMFVQCILFFALFLLRKRIMNIFSLGSKQLQYIREGMSSTFVEPAKKGVQGTTTAIGAVGGAMVGGVHGAMIGSNLGGSVGQAVTGDKSITDSSRDVALNYSLHENMQQRKASELLNSQRELERESREAMKNEQETNKLYEMRQNVDRFQHLSDGLKDKGLSDETIRETHDELEKANLRDLTDTEMQNAFETVKEKAEEGEMNNTFAKEFAKTINSTRLEDQLKKEKEMLSRGSDNTNAPNIKTESSGNIVTTPKDSSLTSDMPPTASEGIPTSEMPTTDIVGEEIPSSSIPETPITETVPKSDSSSKIPTTPIDKSKQRYNQNKPQNNESSVPVGSTQNDFSDRYETEELKSLGSYVSNQETSTPDSTANERYTLDNSIEPEDHDNSIELNNEVDENS